MFGGNMNPQPLVSVICLCYNQAPFVREALQSIIDQTYKNIEIIVVDDASSDESVHEIQSFIANHPNIAFIKNAENIGNCRSFNKAFRQSHGEYIIDLAADDVLMPARIEKGIEDLHSSDAGVQYTRVDFIDKDGNSLESPEPSGYTPEGDIYRLLIERYFINPASMMIKRGVLEELGGYNEKLYYEDFDFWIRSSRNWKYLYNSEALVKKRDVKNSLSKKQFRFLNRHQYSTLEVCRTILELNRNKEEDRSLQRRIYYEVKQSLKYGNVQLIPSYLQLFLKSFGNH